MIRTSIRFGILLGAAVFFGAVPSALCQVMSVHSELHHDVSPAVRDLPVTFGEGIEHEAEPIRRIPLPPGLKRPEDPDPVLQKGFGKTPQQTQPGTMSVSPAASSFTPQVNLGFDGIGQGVFGFSVSVAPPDTNGAVGLTQYVQWVNLSFAVFDKATGNLIKGPVAGNSLWQGFGGVCETTNRGDPVVSYDKLANRWVFSQFAFQTDSNGNPSSQFTQCVAVSTTSDATGTYNRYSYAYSQLNDYPKLGVWPDAYYFTFNMFDGSNNFLGANTCAYDRNAMVNGQTATQVCFASFEKLTLLPSDLDGTTLPPAGSPNYMLNFGSNSLDLFKFHVDFVTPSNSSLSGPTVIPVAAFTPLCNGGTCVPQSGTTTQLDSLGDRLMYRLAYRNFGSHESLVVNHSVAVGSGGGIRWYEIQNPNGTPNVVQQSTFAPDGNFRWMGSIAMDHSGDIAVGYSVSGSSMFPAIAYAGRLPSDSLSTLEPEVTVINGGGSQTGNCTSTARGPCRWGDYSAMQVDPVDDCTFWYTTEYLKASGSFNWNTRIAKFKFPTCVNIPAIMAAINNLLLN
jgi:hypothetical protein